jgi:IS5 family transposase
MNREIYTVADHEIEKRVASIDHFLKDVHTLVNWDRIRKVLSKADIRNQSHAGRDCYDPVNIFKVMLVQSWNKLSDYQMEEQLKLNWLFMWFCGFSFEQPIPDHSTICRWRQRFIKANLFEKLFEEVNKQLAKHGLKVKEGVIVDATLVMAHARPHRKEIVETEPIGDDEIPSVQTFQTTELTVEESKDPDARWLKKGGKCTFGFKGHVAVDKITGLIQTVLVTPANMFDGNMLKAVIDNLKLKSGQDVLADKGYYSADNINEMIKKDLIPWLMAKKPKNKEASPFMVNYNLQISKLRYIVERTFGSLKKHNGWSRTNYMGLEKTTNYMLVGAMAFNLKRSTVLLS